MSQLSPATEIMFVSGYVDEPVMLQRRARVLGEQLSQPQLVEAIGSDWTTDHREGTGDYVFRLVPGLKP